MREKLFMLLPSGAGNGVHILVLTPVKNSRHLSPSAKAGNPHGRRMNSG